MEILSPAGSYESVLAAVANGANAVYLGMKNLSARANAANFDENELKSAVEFCHARNVLVYLTVNTMILDNEIRVLRQILKSAAQLNVDALIIQDLGLMRFVKETCPNMKLHASTQMTIHSVNGAKAAKKLGFERIVLSRELSLNAIKEITQTVDIQTEVFVHGALCMSVSGQCYMSAMIGGRSANKGNCAGTCRMPHSLNQDKDSFALSLKDLCSANVFNGLAQANVSSLKIEGRMKRAEYVAAVTKAYAGLKDGIAPDIDMLKAVFSRSGFTDGYLKGSISPSMFGYRTKEDVTAATDNIFKELSQTYNKIKPTIPVDMKISILRNEPIALTISDDSGHSATVTGDCPQTAINKAIDTDSVTASLKKLGDTPYYIAKINCEISENLAVSKSTLNDLRRRAVDALTQLRLKRNVCVYSDFEPEYTKRETIINKTIRASFYDINQIPFDMIDNIEYIYLPIDLVHKNMPKLSKISQKVVVTLPRFFMKDETNLICLLRELKENGFVNISVSNLSHIEIATELKLNMFGSSFLNIANSQALLQFEEMGVKDVQLSVEMTVPQINHMAKTSQKIGVQAYGHLPLMLMANSPIGEEKTGEIFDRMGNKFTILRNDFASYAELFNRSALNISDKVDEFKSVDFINLFFTTETKSQCEKIISQFQAKSAPEGDFTRGLYYRGLNKNRNDKNKK